MKCRRGGGGRENIRSENAVEKCLGEKKFASLSIEHCFSRIVDESRREVTSEEILRNLHKSLKQYKESYSLVLSIDYRLQCKVSPMTGFLASSRIRLSPSARRVAGFLWLRE